jgi:hypothetical protein
MAPSVVFSILIISGVFAIHIILILICLKLNK